MKKRFLGNYYSRLMFITLVSVFLLLMVCVIFVMTLFYNEKINSVVEVHDKVLQELAQEHKEIWISHHDVFSPLYLEKNKAYLRSFCKGEDEGYEKSKIHDSMKDMFFDICQRNEDLEAIIFRRLYDDSEYLYINSRDNSKNILTEINLDLGNKTIDRKYYRTVIGGVNMTHKSTAFTEFRENVFGFQSGILTVDGLTQEQGYQVTFLYTEDIFERILAKYNINPKARFYMVMSDGIVIYDSNGQYRENEEVKFEDIERITTGKERIQVGDATFITGREVLNGNKGTVFYLIPENVVTKFQFDYEEKICVVIAIGIFLLVFFSTFLINRLIRKKFLELEQGMCQVGKNNLGYRIPINQSEDEFAQVAEYFNQMCDDLEEMIAKNYTYQMLQQNAEYKALQASINPHFLFNAFEILREKLESENQMECEEMVLLLSKIFEYQIRGSGLVTIQKEKEALQSYIDFSAIRYQYAFEAVFDFEDEISKIMIPKQIFQPIAENYFCHGFRGDENDCIHIRGYLDKKDGMIHICFRDNGKGLTMEEVQKVRASLEKEDVENSHIGLSNVHRRLQIAFGKNCGVEIESNAPEPGVTVSLIIRME